MFKSDTDVSRQARLAKFLSREPGQLTRWKHVSRSVQSQLLCTTQQTEWSQAYILGLLTWILLFNLAGVVETSFQLCIYNTLISQED